MNISLKAMLRPALIALCLAASSVAFAAGPLDGKVFLGEAGEKGKAAPK